MAYDVNYLYEHGQRSAEELLSSLIQGLRDAGVGAGTAQMSRGTDWPEALDWVSGELTSGGRDTGINVEIHTDDMSVNLAWESVADSPGAPARPANIGTCTLTLVGDIDWETFESVRTVLCDLWAAAEYDSADGFTNR